MGSGNYKREIARARTFGFSKDVDMMRARGLGLGGSMDNVIVVDESKVLNAEGCATTTSSSSTRSSTRSATWRWPAAHPGRLQRLQVGACAEQQAAAQADVRSRCLRHRHDRGCVAASQRPERAGSGLVGRSISMLIFRWIVLLLLVSGLLCFAMYRSRRRPVAAARHPDRQVDGDRGARLLRHCCSNAWRWCCRTRTRESGRW